MSRYVTRKTPGDTAWFTHDRFGMFIHFGLYAMGGRGEWIRSQEYISDAEYQKFFEEFNPDKLDVRAWAKSAKAAGMKYAVLTAKHHDGFCLFDTKYTDFNVMNTPYGKDIVRDYVDAMREEGIRVGLYYSLVDWHHPDYTLDQWHPMRNTPDPAGFNRGRDMHRYAEYMRNQLTELMSNYGKIDILWLDFSMEKDPAFEKSHPCITTGKGRNEWESEKLIETVRKLQPDILIDNRADIEQDIFTPEQYLPRKWLTHPETGELVVWEACHTMSCSWGYYRNGENNKTPEMLIQALVRAVSLGGNLLVNIGPNGRGAIDRRDAAGLSAYAEWMDDHARSIYGCTMADAEFRAPEGCILTQSEDGKRLYVHLVEYPFHLLELHGFAGKVKYAQFLDDGSEIAFSEGGSKHISIGREEGDDLLVLYIPDRRPPVILPVIELILK